MQSMYYVSILILKEESMNYVARGGEALRHALPIQVHVTVT